MEGEKVVLDAVKEKSLCDSCITPNCMFQHGIHRKGCAYYTTVTPETIRNLGKWLIQLADMADKKEETNDNSGRQRFW